MKRIFILLVFIVSVTLSFTVKWGFYAHQKINKMAVFTLPPEMIGFYKKNIDYITEHSVSADKRRHTIKNEAAFHYIDLDEYGDSAIFKIPKSWTKAVEKYGEDSLLSKGVVPWHVTLIKNQLTKAFKETDINKILKLSADLGHYIADANVPLHTTKNYNGQLTGQHGIHAFWESRLPEMFGEGYDFFTGPATYIENPQMEVWKAIENANNALDTVLVFEKKLSKKFNEDKKYVFENKNGVTVKTYSTSFCKSYHNMLNGQIERRMKASIKMVGDFWYTAWVDAGQPNLNDFNRIIDVKPINDTLKIRNNKVREHDF